MEKNKEVKSAEEILDKHLIWEHADDRGWNERKRVTDAMEEYAWLKLLFYDCFDKFFKSQSISKEGKEDEN